MRFLHHPIVEPILLGAASICIQCSNVFFWDILNEFETPSGATIWLLFYPFEILRNKKGTRSAVPPK
jgi:hypothetical protein